MIKIGDPDQTVTGAHTYDIAYRVEGALNAFRDHDELYWNAIGDEWSVPIRGRDASTSRSPGTITQFTCFQGPTGSSLPCDDADVRRIRHRAVRLGVARPYEALTIVVGMAKGSVVPEPAPILVDRLEPGARAFTLNPLRPSAIASAPADRVRWCCSGAWRGGPAATAGTSGSAVDVAFGPGGVRAPDEPHGAAATQEQAVPLFETQRLPDRVRAARQAPAGRGRHADRRGRGPAGRERHDRRPGRARLPHDRGDPEARAVRQARLATHADEGRRTTALKPYESKLLTSLFARRRAGRDAETAEPQVLMSSLRTKFSKKLLAVENALYDDARQAGLVPDAPRQGARALDARSAGSC